MAEKTNLRNYYGIFVSFIITPGVGPPCLPGTELLVTLLIFYMKARLMKAIDKGVTIVAGSDNYTDINVSRGVSSMDMFRTYYEAGMKPLNNLQSATYLSAKSLNKENEIGILKPDAFADIIAIKGDIESDFINSLENIIFVMKGGKIYLNRIP